MDNLNLNLILNRNKIEQDFRNKLIHFEMNKTDLSIKRGFFFYGNSGVGKTEFVIKILRDLDYDVIMFDSNDIRNKSIIEGITKYNMNDKNVLSMFSKKPKKIAIFMDEIDSMNNGDKGGLTSLIKLIRCKKTKKQQQEDYSLNPVICVGNCHFDKKNTELKKVAHSYEIKNPKEKEVLQLLNTLMPSLKEDFKKNIINYINGDLRKINYIYKIYKNNPNTLNTDMLKNIFQIKVNNEFSKDLTKKIINNKVDLEEHNIIINETDRTSISLLFHENIIDILGSDKKYLDYYEDILNNYCFADYLDRVTFQKQIWIFNELTSLIKTIHSNNLYYNRFSNDKTKKLSDPVRFTKILTKYSTEYNNQTFLNNLCQVTHMEKDDLKEMFLSNIGRFNDQPNDIYREMSELNISKLEVDRMYRFINNIYY